MNRWGFHPGLVLLMILCPTVRAQEGAPAERPGTVDTHVNDSFEATELLARLNRNAAERRWTKAAEHVATLFLKHGAQLTSAGEGRYESVSRRLNAVLATWPPAGIAAYEDMIADGARAALAEAVSNRDLDGLLALLERTLRTTLASDVADAACDLAIESGDFTTGRRVCLRMIEDRSDGAPPPPRFVGRLAVIAALDRREGDAERWLTRFGALSDSGVIRWLGDDVPLAPLVRSLASDARSAEAGGDAERWPVFGGDAGRSGVGGFVFDRMALLWRFDGLGADVPDARRRAGAAHATRDISETGKMLVFNPVVGHGLVYFQSADEIWAIRDHTGNPAWRWGRGVASDRTRYGGTESSTADWYSPSLRGDRLYACVGGETVPQYGYEAAAPSAYVVCLDARTGREIWRSRESETRIARERARYDASPLVTGDSVYVVMRRRRTFGFEDCYLVRLRASDGSRVYETHLGSASVGGFGYRRSTLSIPAMRDGTVYVATNLGTVAAVDARTGLVEWLQLYARQGESQWRSSVRASLRDVQPWHFNPVVCVGDRMVCRPMDAPVVLVLNRSDGRVIHSLDAASLGGADTILGAIDGRMFVLGREVYCVDIASGRAVWTSPLPSGATPYGRGMLVANKALVPTDRGLCGYDLVDGSVIEQDWDGRNAPGNLLAMPSRLIVAGPDHISAYGRKADVWKRLRALMVERPRDPAPVLDLAEVAFRSESVDEALALLDQAVQRAGGFASMTDADLRARMFADCLWFARDWPDQGDTDSRTVDRLYEYAGQCAPDRAGHLEYRFRYAEHLNAAGEVSRAVRLYQQILDDRSLREAGWGNPEDAMSAGRFAALGIERAIAAEGREVYAAFDADATAWLRSARATGDLELLDRIIETRPAARVTPDAMKLKASLLRARGSPVAAAAVMQSALSRFGDQMDRAETVRFIADCYGAAGRDDYAWRWLTRAIETDPRAHVHVDGASVSLKRYREKFDAGRPLAEIPRPAIGRTIKSRYEREFGFDIELLEPRFSRAPEARWDAAYVWGEGAIHAIDPPTGASIWKVPAACPRRGDLLLAGDHRVLLATGSRVMALDADSGVEVWSAGYQPRGLDDADTDPEMIAAFYGHALDGGRIFSMVDDGRAGCVEIGTGRTIWQRKLRHRPTSQPVMLDRWIAYRGRERGNAALCILDAATGALHTTIDVDDESQLLRLHLTLDGTLVAVFSRRLEAYGVERGERRWRYNTENNIVDATVWFDLDAVFLAERATRITRIALDDGARVWESKPLPVIGLQSARTAVAGRSLLVLTENGTCCLDAGDGRVLWKGPDRGAIDSVRAFVTRSAVVRIEGPGPERAGDHTAHWLALDAGGPFEKESVALDLGSLQGVRQFAVYDAAILARLDGGKLQGWSTAP